ncbi:MAG: GreA/GreB family elongation factor [Candidatus Magasanikbacteria bacterium]
MQLPKRKPGKYSQIPTDHAMSMDKFEQMERDLIRLKKKKPGAAREVARLAELGDFSENVEYQQAKRKLRGILSGILKVDYLINHAEVIEPTGGDTVQLGSTVTIKIPKGERVYTILGASEADPEKGVISHQSPLGSALIGLKKGDVVEVKKVGRCEIDGVK